MARSFRRAATDVLRAIFSTSIRSKFPQLISFALDAIILFEKLLPIVFVSTYIIGIMEFFFIILREFRSF